MTIAQQILDRARGAHDARDIALNHGCNVTYVNGLEVLTFWQDNSVLMIFGASVVIAGKGA